MGCGRRGKVPRSKDKTTRPSGSKRNNTGRRKNRGFESALGGSKPGEGGVKKTEKDKKKSL